MTEPRASRSRKLIVTLATLTLVLSACLFPFAPTPGPPSQELEGDNLTFRASPSSVQGFVSTEFTIALEQELDLPASAPQRTVQVDIHVIDPDGILTGLSLDDFADGDGTSQPRLVPNLTPGVPGLFIESVGSDSISRQRLKFLCGRPGMARINLTVGQLIPGEASFTAMGTLSIEVTCQVLVIPPVFPPFIDLPFDPWTFVGGIGPILGGNHEREGDPDAPATPPAASGDILDLDPDRDYAIVTGSDRLAIIDLADGAEVERLRMPFGPYTDAVVLIAPDGADSSEWLVFFDDEGGFSMSPYNPMAKTWGIIQIIPSGGLVTDLVPGPTDAQGLDSGFVVVNAVNDTVDFWIWNETVGDWSGEAATVTPRRNGAWRDSGNAVSSIGGFGGGKALVAVSDGNDPGSLWLFDSGSDEDADDQLIGALGADPTQLRCLNGVCLVINFGDDAITTITWSPPAMPVMVQSVEVDDGPRNLDLIHDPDGSGVLALVASPTMGSVTLLQVDGNGEVKTLQSTLMGGCPKPTSAHFTDGEGTEMMVACSDSNEIFLVPR